MRFTLILALSIAGSELIAQSPRTNFHAKYEPRSGVLTGAGQGGPADVKLYSAALDGKANPVIYMDYMYVHTIDLNKYFRELQVKLDSLGWYAVPQIGLAMVDEKGSHPYDDKVAAGEYDDNIRRIAFHLKSLHRPVFLRIGFEFDGFWNGYKPESYILAFRRVVDILRKAGVKNVATVWCAESDFLTNDYMKYYPGDKYVDWWAIDLFEAKYFESPPVETFMRDAMRNQKPVMIGESTPRHVGVLDGEKSWKAWFAPYFSFIGKHPNVKAFCYINWDWSVWAPRYSMEWADWGDARLQMNSEVSRLFLEEVSKPLYIKAGDKSASLK
jgi:hypothetical protein